VPARVGFRPEPTFLFFGSGKSNALCISGQISSNRAESRSNSSSVANESHRPRE